MIYIFLFLYFSENQLNLLDVYNLQVSDMVLENVIIMFYFIFLSFFFFLHTYFNLIPELIVFCKHIFGAIHVFLDQFTYSILNVNL